MVERVSADVTFPLRHRVLGRHARPEELARPDDDAPDSGHFAVYGTQGEVVATGTVRRQAAPPPLEAEQGWQVRGVAVADDLRGGGLGTSVLSALVRHVASCGGGLMWCHVRARAVSLYGRMGFVRYGEPVEDEVAGPQVLMARLVEPTAS